MSATLIPFDDNLLAHVANYWAFDDWEEADLGREDRFAEAAHLFFQVDPEPRLPVA